MLGTRAHRVASLADRNMDENRANNTHANAGRRRPPSLVVGIGASAGGLAAFRSFFDNMPADTGKAFVLVQHLDPDHKSLLVELLQHRTAMQVVEAPGSRRACAQPDSCEPSECNAHAGGRCAACFDAGSRGR
jgi:chemotaxis response regulator CheB